MTNGTHELVFSRDLGVARNTVWRCWTEPDLLKQWFCPKPWYVSDARMDVRPGGEFYTLMNGPNGEQFGEPGVYLDVEHGRRLVFTDAFRPGWMPSSRAFMVATVTFDDLPNAATKYEARVRHWTEDARDEHDKMGFQDGWGKAADQLEALARTL